MSFLHPLAFWMAALIPAIILLYMIRSRWREARVSTLMFWQRAMERSPQKRFLGRIRNLLSLLLQIAIFLLILFSLVRPEWRGLNSANTVIVLDTRARMQAGDGRVFQKAMDMARNLAEQASPSSEVAVLTAEATPRVVAPFSDNPRITLEALKALPPSDGGGDLEAAIDLARKMLASRPGTGRLQVITDRPYAGKLNPGEEAFAVGSPSPNAGITAFSVQSLPGSPQSLEAFLRVDNFDDAEREVEIDLTLDGMPFDSFRHSLKSGEAWDISIPITKERIPATARGLVAKLKPKDTLDTDNIAYASLPAREPLRILLVSAENTFLENVLRADPTIQMEMLAPESWKNGMTSSFDVVIFDNWTPPDFDPAHIDGRLLFFGASPFDKAGSGEGETWTVRADDRSAMLRNVDLEAVRFLRSRTLPLPALAGWKFDVPAESTQGPLILTGQQEASPKSRVVVFAFGTGDSDLPLRVAFPLLMSNALHWLAADGETMSSWAAGQTLVLAEWAKVIGPQREIAADGTPDNPPLAGRGVPLRKNGFYEIQEDSSRKWMAVNTSDQNESDLRQNGASSVTASSLSLPGGWSAWRILALAALVLLALEWHLHHRRITE